MTPLHKERHVTERAARACIWATLTNESRIRKRHSYKVTRERPHWDWEGGTAKDRSSKEPDISEARARTTAAFLRPSVRPSVTSATISSSPELALPPKPKA